MRTGQGRCAPRPRSLLRSYLAARSLPGRPPRRAEPPCALCSPATRFIARNLGRTWIAVGPRQTTSSELERSAVVNSHESCVFRRAFPWPSEHVGRRFSTSRGVAPEVSAQRGTSGAVNGGGGRSAPDPAHVMTIEPCRIPRRAPSTFTPRKKPVVFLEADVRVRRPLAKLPARNLRVLASPGLAARRRRLRRSPGRPLRVSLR